MREREGRESESSWMEGEREGGERERATGRRESREVTRNCESRLYREI